MKSDLAARLADDLLCAPGDLHRQALKQHVVVAELPHLLREVKRAVGSRFGLWADTPSGFIEDVLGETIWSKQRQIVDSVLDAERITVPAVFGVGKTWIAARLCAWAGCVNPAGSSARTAATR
ncbi:hypothetical protein [Streptomyces sp. NRRL S-340]|uniref:hypothetical protein n=1 Tax=Streptomyces sp. NRRL S-340 TaxID=1463901 RepID=UPI000569135B|nr:hypothetical protein [Streptomyces sp. NRRL S-340]